MSDPLWLADVLRDAGLTVVEYPGWKTRGHGDFGEIRGVLMHHTGSNPPSNNPGYIANHPDLGLASQLHLSRDGVWTVVGAGIAWHAGNGQYGNWVPRNQGNTYLIGVEAENNGTEGWLDVQYDSYMRGVAAILTKLDEPWHHAIGHKEYAGETQGKWDPGGMDMDEARGDIAALMDGDDMPSAAEIAKAVWEQRVAKPDGTTEQAGIMLGWVDQHAGDALDQLAGTDTAKQRTGSKALLKPTGWPQLAKPPAAIPPKPSLIDGVATRADLETLRQHLSEISSTLDAIVARIEPGQ